MFMLFKCVSVRSGTCAAMAPGLVSGPGHSGCRRLFDVGSCFEALSKHLKGAAGFPGSCVYQIWHGHKYTLRHQNPFLHMYKRMQSYWHSFFPSRGRLFQDSCREAYLIHWPDLVERKNIHFYHLHANINRFSLSCTISDDTSLLLLNVLK